MRVYVVFAKFYSFDDELVAIAATPEAAQKEVERRNAFKHDICSGHEFEEYEVITE